MAEHTLASRDKNDIFWVKKRRYMVSLDYKNKSVSGIFNPDMVAEVKAAYERENDGPGIFELTGDEFMDPPPTASGQIAFCKSVAMMMHTVDDKILEKQLSEEKYYQGFENVIRDIRDLIRQIVDSYFVACGEDIDGNECHDRKKIKDAQKSFYSLRDDYKNLIKVKRKEAGYEVIDAIRKENGIAEYIETDETGEDPLLNKLIEENKEAYESCRDKIEPLLEISRKNIIEISRRKASIEALYEPVSAILDDKNENDRTHHFLRWSLDVYLSEIDSINRDLLYRREAVYYLARWILLAEPVDRLIAEKISLISDEKPDVLDDNKCLKDISGYARPAEDAYKGLDYSDVNAVFELGEEFQQYLSDHPFQFESQCLLSISHRTDDLSVMLPKAWEVIQAIDKMTITGQFAGLSEDDRQRLFEVWVLADVISIVGYSISELIIGDPDRTIKEASLIMENILPMLSYSTVEKYVRKMLLQIVMERSGLRVS